MGKVDKSDFTFIIYRIRRRLSTGAREDFVDEKVKRTNTNIEASIPVAESHRNVLGEYRLQLRAGTPAYKRLEAHFGVLPKGVKHRDLILQLNFRVPLNILWSARHEKPGKRAVLETITYRMQTTVLESLQYSPLRATK